NCKEFIFKKQNKDSSIYSINSIEFKELIKCKEKKYTLLYIYSPSCMATREKMGDVVKLLKNKNTDIMFTSIEDDHSRALFNYYRFFLNIDYTYPLFLISNNYSNNNDKKLRLFLEELNPDRDY